MITIHQRHRQTDGRSDGRTERQTTCDRNTALCTKVHRAVKIDWGNNVVKLKREWKRFYMSSCTYTARIYIWHLCRRFMHYKRKTKFWKGRPSLLIRRSARRRHGLDWLCKQWLTNTSVLGSKNVSGVRCVAPEYTNYFHKYVNVSFHRLSSDKQQLLRRWMQSLEWNPSSDPAVSESASSW